MKQILLVTLGIILSIISLRAETYHVKPDGNDNNDGLTWQNSFATIQKALETAKMSDAIYVSEGLYIPTSTNETNIGERGQHFRLSGEVALYGGFPNTGSPTMEERNPSVFKSIISGDLNGDDFWNEQTQKWENRDDNCYHLFFVKNEKNNNDTSIIDGFTLQSGNSNSEEIDSLNCRGGAIYFTKQNLQINNCLLKNNYAFEGGAIYFENSDFKICNSLILKNSARSLGGGINADFFHLLLINCIIAENNAWQGTGGGIFLKDSEMEMINCTITKNYARIEGGGLFLYAKSWLMGEDSYYGNCKILNSILQGNTSNERSRELCMFYSTVWPDTWNYAKTTLDYTNVSTGIYSIGGEIEKLKCYNFTNSDFVEKGDNPYMLKHNSPCRDKGNNDFVTEDYDIRGNGFPRKLNGSDATSEGTVDLGAYEYNSVKDIVSVNDTENNLHFEIFPNPASDFINIQLFDSFIFSKDSQIQIFDILGFEVMNTSVVIENRSFNLNVSELKPGVYYIKTGNITSKFLKI